MYIPTDKELLDLLSRFKGLMRYVASGQVSLEKVLGAVNALMPEKGTKINRPLLRVDCSVAPHVEGAKVVMHHAHSDLQLTFDDMIARTTGTLQIECPKLLSEPLADLNRGIANAIPVRIEHRLLPPANLAFYFFTHQHLIPWNWWNETIVMPGTVYEREDGSKFFIGLACVSGIFSRSMFGSPEEVSPREVILTQVSCSQFSGMWQASCAVILSQ